MSRTKKNLLDEITILKIELEESEKARINLIKQRDEIMHASQELAELAITQAHMLSLLILPTQITTMKKHFEIPQDK